MNTDQEHEAWLRNRIRAASAMSPSQDFTQKVMLGVIHDVKTATVKAQAPSRRPLTVSSIQFFRRRATIFFWSGLAVFVVAIVLSASQLPLNTLTHVSIQSDSPTFMAVGIILVVIAGLAVWEWVDQYI
ncbi:MAG: hypothetical protein SGJ05_11690 [bacterium]|nr:hypothetical protein [bacterium]